MGNKARVSPDYLTEGSENGDLVKQNTNRRVSEGQGAGGIHSMKLT